MQTSLKDQNMENKDLESKEEKIKKLIQGKIDSIKYPKGPELDYSLPSYIIESEIDTYLKKLNKCYDQIDILKELLKEIETL